MSPSKREAIRMMFGGMCAYCGIALDGKWHVDHVEPVMRDSKWIKGLNGNPGKFLATGKLWMPQNARADNLYPACIPCNIDKGANSLEGWREWLNSRIIEDLRNNSATFRHAERFGRVTISTEPMVFWFEKYADRSCKETK